MPNLARISKHTHLAPYFAQVFPLFWPVLYWQLVKMSAQLRAAGCREALGRVTWWGGVYIEILGDKVEAPSAHKPLGVLRNWVDPMPAPAILEALRAVLPRICDEAVSPQGQWTLAPRADTS